MALFPSRAGGRSARGRLHVVFDVSDVINYFRYGRLPTGIQRVQIEVVEYAIRNKGRDFDFSIACFTKEANTWIEISKAFFGELSRHSVGDADRWPELTENLEYALTRGKAFAFPEGAVLLNLGSSWWLQNYFLGVRLAKSRFNIRYVPFIHDFIPMVMPELCVEELRNNFVEWIESVFEHADHFLVNSQSTLKDLQIASKLAGADRDAAVITLDADFRNAPTRTAEPMSAGEADAGLASLGLARGRFVLFVSTIEPRKNHAMVFSAWLKLIRKYGARNCPRLVCVGQRGWLNDKAHARLAASEELIRQVAVLSDVSDAMLGVLYQGCICTLYPSLYEGWGLPVTESLSFGKVPVVSNVASLPEAGGAFAEYFDVRSEREFIDAVERVVFDRGYRQAREQKIAAEFRPRSWQSIGEQILGQLDAWAAKPVRSRYPVQSRWEAIVANALNRLRAWVTGVPVKPPRIFRDIYPVRAQTGVFYSLAGEVQDARGRDAKRGEIFRNGTGWWWPEPWGCWIRGRGPAQIGFVIGGVKGARLCVYLGVRGTQGHSGTLVVQASQHERTVVPLAGDEERIVAMTLEAEPDVERQIVLSISSDAVADFRVPTEGRDFRVCGIGIKWFYVCREDDLRARLDLMEMLQTEDAIWFGAAAFRAS